MCDGDFVVFAIVKNGGSGNDGGGGAVAAAPSSEFGGKAAVRVGEAVASARAAFTYC